MILPTVTSGSFGSVLCHNVRGREIDSGRTNTWGLKINEEKVIPF